jgi:hypothetical protein
LIRGDSIPRDLFRDRSAGKFKEDPALTFEFLIARSCDGKVDILRECEDGTEGSEGGSCGIWDAGVATPRKDEGAAASNGIRKRIFKASDWGVRQNGANVDSPKKYGFAVQSKKPRYNRGFMLGLEAVQRVRSGVLDA